MSRLTCQPSLTNLQNNTVNYVLTQDTVGDTITLCSMLFHAQLRPRIPAHLTQEMAEDYQSRQQGYIQSLIDDRVALHIWRAAGTRELFIVFEATSHKDAHTIIRAMPLARYTDTVVTALAAS